MTTDPVLVHPPATIPDCPDCAPAAYGPIGPDVGGVMMTEDQAEALVPLVNHNPPGPHWRYAALSRIVLAITDELARGGTKAVTPKGVGEDPRVDTLLKLSKELSRLEAQMAGPAVNVSGTKPGRKATPVADAGPFTPNTG